MSPCFPTLKRVVEAGAGAAAGGGGGGGPGCAAGGTGNRAALAQCGGDSAGSHGDKHLSACGGYCRCRVVSALSVLLGDANQFELAGAQSKRGDVLDRRC